MAKRKKEENSDGSDFEGFDDAGESDASYSAPKKKPARARGRGQAVKSKSKSTVKRRKTTSAVELEVEIEECSVTSTTTTSNPYPHPPQTHVLQNAKETRKALLEWYGGVRDARGMPWRKRFDPGAGRGERAQRAYEVWVSEIMLQQTQVATVIPYYNRWMEKFPTITDLATAPPSTVTSLWKGLGYYSRASRLHSGAQKVVNELGGRLPDNAKDMQGMIPGVGRYSAGAVCSIAYGEKVPVLDGNVHRLLSRLLMLHANPKAKATLDVLWKAAEGMVDVEGQPTDPSYENPGDINQALIELGSTDSGGSSGPAQAGCYQGTQDSLDSKGAQSTLKGTQAQHTEDTHDIEDIETLCTLCAPLPASSFEVTLLPMKAEKKRAREEVDAVCVVEWRRGGVSDCEGKDSGGDRDNKEEERWFLLVKRPEKGLLAGLHEFPTLENVSESTGKEEGSVVRRVLEGILAEPIRGCGSPVQSESDDDGGHESNEGREGQEEKETPGVRVKRDKSLGDVLHLFSHVKKTYRARWVRLEGGREPPVLVSSEARVEGKGVVGAQKGAKASKGKGKATMKVTAKGIGKAKGKANLDEDAAETEAPREACWVRMDEVDHANISTGMVKVWALAKARWEKDGT